MNSGCQVSEKYSNRLVPERFDRTAALPDAAQWLARVATQVRLAVIAPIPVGFEDEAGFHYGMPRSQANRRPVPKPVFTNANQF